MEVVTVVQPVIALSSGRNLSNGYVVLDLRTDCSIDIPSMGIEATHRASLPQHSRNHYHLHDRGMVAGLDTHDDTLYYPGSKTGPSVRVTAPLRLMLTGS